LLDEKTSNFVYNIVNIKAGSNSVKRMRSEPACRSVLVSEVGQTKTPIAKHLDARPPISVSHMNE
jgi:hypothetical protein